MICRVNPWCHTLCHTITASHPLCFSVWKEDSGKYYTWRSFGPGDQRTRELWVDMSDVRHGQVRVHGILSNSYKQAVVSLECTHKDASSFLCGIHVAGHQYEAGDSCYGEYIFAFGSIGDRIWTTVNIKVDTCSYFINVHPSEYDWAEMTYRV